MVPMLFSRCTVRYRSKKTIARFPGEPSQCPYFYKGARCYLLMPATADSIPYTGESVPLHGPCAPAGRRGALDGAILWARVELRTGGCQSTVHAASQRSGGLHTSG